MNEQKVEKNESSISRTMRILVVDDELGIRQMLQRELRSRGHQVEEASSGAEGLKKINAGQFDLVISDIKMPGMDGFQFLKKIKEINPQIEVIMCTGFSTLDLAISCIKEGAYDFITKPYNLIELRTRIDKLIQKKELNRQVTALTELNRLKSEFLANTSHELRTPMSAIIGYSQLFLNHTYGKMTEEQTTGMNRISSNAKNLLQLINNLLDASRMSAGKMPLYIESFNLRELIIEVMETMKVFAMEKGVALEFSSGDDLKINSDKTRVKQILINLLSNAVKFTSRGGVIISYTVDPHNTHVHIVVKDTGIGIKPEYMKTIFDDFMQGDASTTRAYGGTGLGLSIVKKIVALLGGNIEVKSAVEKGSEFTITLPVQPKPEQKEIMMIDPSSLKLKAEPGNKMKEKNILLSIDDDPEVLKLIDDTLRGSEYQMVGSLNGDEGIALAKELHPFAITVDILMPHRDGWSVIQSLKNDPQTRSIPVIILSIMENKNLGFSIGASDYMTKPFNPELFLERLRILKLTGEKKVLITDDDLDMNELMVLPMKKEGYHTFSAYDGEEALATIEKEKPDLVLLDLMMPKMDGFEVLEQMAKNPALKDVKVVIVTAKTLSAQEIETLKKRSEFIIDKSKTSFFEIPLLINKLFKIEK